MYNSEPLVLLNQGPGGTPMVLGIYEFREWITVYKRVLNVGPHMKFSRDLVHIMTYVLFYGHVQVMSVLVVKISGL